jgi:hypothetical protein
MYIAIDFDGTCVANSFPYIGKDIGSVPVLKKLVEKGHKLILYTLRSNNRTTGIYGDALTNAMKWFVDNGIELYDVNDNPAQDNFSSSKKVYADLYIDDSNLGCPLKEDYDISGQPFADWDKIERILKDKKIL